MLLLFYYLKTVLPHLFVKFEQLLLQSVIFRAIVVYQEIMQNQTHFQAYLRQSLN